MLRRRERQKKVPAFDTELDLKYNLISFSKSSFSTNTRDISKAGISILVYEILPKDSLLEMEILVPNSKEVIKLRGRVAWCEDRNGVERFDKDGKRTFLSGVELADTGKKHQEIFTEYIKKYLSDNK